VKLASTGGIRREAARLYREALNGQRDTLDAARLVGILRLIADLIQGGDLEGRLEALERRFDGIEDRREIQPKLNGGIRHAARP
jgi:hypothetical protein